MSVTDASMARENAGSDRRGAAVMLVLAEFWHDLVKTMFDPYRPERHYMRGPGPACARKRAQHLQVPR